MTTGVALIGAGTVAQLHVDALTATDGACLAAVIDPDLRAASALAGRSGAVVATRLSELPSGTDFDAVIIAAPTPLHRNLAMEVIRAGKHVLVEKPLTSSLREAEELIVAADSAGIRLVSGQVMRFMPMFEWARQFVAGGHLGDLVQVIERRLTYREKTFQWWHGRPDILIGHWGSHSIDIVTYLTGAVPESAFCAATDHMPGVEGVDDCTTVLTLRPAGTLTSHFSFIAKRAVHDIVLIGTDATIEFDCYRSVAVNGNVVMEMSPRDMLARGFAAQLTDFFDGIQSGACRAEARTVLSTLAAIDAAQRSLREHAVAPIAGGNL